MKSQTSLIANQVRLQKWALQVKDCQNRPIDMDVEAWCKQNNITKACYYYRFRRVREACIEMTGQESFPTFVELPEPTESRPVTKSIEAPVASITLSTGITIDLRENASCEFLSKLIGVLQHVQ